MLAMKGLNNFETAEDIKSGKVQ